MKEASIFNNIEIINNVINQYIKKGNQISGIQFIYNHEETTKPSEISIGYSSEFPKDIKKRYYKIQKNRYGGITSSMRLNENKILKYINSKHFKKNDNPIPVLIQIRITDDNKIGFFIGKTIDNEKTDFGNNDFTLGEGELFDPLELTSISVNIWNLPKTWQGEINKLYFYFDKGAKVSDFKWIDKNGKVLDKNLLIIENIERYLNNKNEKKILKDIALNSSENLNKILENFSLKINTNLKNNENENKNKILDEIYLKEFISNILIIENDKKNIEDNKYKSELDDLNLKNFIKKQIIDLNTNLIIENNEKSCITIKDFINSLKIEEEEKNIEIEKKNIKKKEEINQHIQNIENLILENERKIENPKVEINKKNNENIENLILENDKKIKNQYVSDKQNIRDHNNLLEQIEDITGIELTLKKKKKEKTITKNDIINNLLALIDS